MATAVGNDVGKAALYLAVDGMPGIVRFANNAVGIGKLVARMGKLTRRTMDSRGCHRRLKDHITRQLLN